MPASCKVGDARHKFNFLFCSGNWNKETISKFKKKNASMKIVPVQNECKNF